MDAAARCGLTALPGQTNFSYVEVPDAGLTDGARYAAALPEVMNEVHAGRSAA